MQNSNTNFTVNCTATKNMPAAADGNNNTMYIWTYEETALSKKQFRNKHKCHGKWETATK